MPEDSSSGDRRSKKRSSSRRISTQRERNNDDEYDYHANRHRQSNDTRSHDAGSSKRSSRKVRSPSPEAARPARKAKTTVVSVRDYDDDSTVSNNDNAAEKWHKKTWVRIFLGVFAILLTVIVTFFVLRATGLGIDNNAANVNAGASSNTPTAMESNAPSSAPTPVPFFTYPAPDEDSCDKKSFETGDTSFVLGENTREFDFTFDVALSFVDTGGEWLEEFESKVNEALFPILVGCIDDDDDDEDDRRLRRNKTHRRRRLRDSDEMEFRFVIADATVVGTLTSELLCPEELETVTAQQIPRQAEICYRVAVYADLLLRGDERVFSLVQLITTILSELSDPEQSEDELVPMPTCTSLLDCMELTSPFKRVSVVGVTNRDPTNSPSISPSQVPTNRPSVIPTNRPSISPTLFPTTRPSFQPSVSPTPLPTPGPTQNPTVRPSSSPTEPPSLLPSAMPSNVPSSSSQPSASSQPSRSQMPSCADFWEAQDTDNTAIDPNDPPDTNCESADENN